MKCSFCEENLFKTVSSVPSEEDLGMSAFHNVPVVSNEISPKRTLAQKLKVADNFEVIDKARFHVI